MKSLLKEASTVSKAIDQAWHEAGKPAEFTIKVFSEGKRSFFGFSKDPAIVSIIYNPNAVLRKAKSTFKTAPKVSSRASAPEKKQERSTLDSTIRPQDRDRQADKKGLVIWEPSYLMDISRWLKDMVDILGVQRTFTLNVDKGLLKIEFNKPIVREAENERMLFASFSYLLMQFIKRKHKSKFRGLRLSITSVR